MNSHAKCYEYCLSGLQTEAEDGDSTFLSNIGMPLPDYVVSFCKTTQSNNTGILCITLTVEHNNIVNNIEIKRFRPPPTHTHLV